MENGEAPRTTVQKPWTAPTRVTLADLNEAQNSAQAASDTVTTPS